MTHTPEYTERQNTVQKENISLCVTDSWKCYNHNGNKGEPNECSPENVYPSVPNALNDKTVEEVNFPFRLLKR